MIDPSDDEALMLLVGSILWNAPDDGATASPAFDKMFELLLRDAPLPIIGALAGMTAIAQELLEAAPEGLRKKFWEHLLPDGPL